MSEDLFRVRGLPVFQNKMFDSAAAARACPTGELALVQDPATGIVVNRCFDPALLAYDADYQNEQGHSAVFQEHLARVAEIVARHCAGRALVEIGCGKGLFLEFLQSRGFSIVGMDPAYEGRNPAIRKEYFRPGGGVRGGALILRHVLEHVRSPLAFLSMLGEANGGGGLIYIEVPCLDWIAANGAWFDLFYEHVNYFRLDDFTRLFGHVLEAGHLFGGQYLYAVADLATLRSQAAAAAPFAFPPGFTRSLQAASTRLGQAAASGRESLVWGAASKGVIFALHMERAGTPVRRITDINPAKQGRYIAATGLRVETPAEVLERLPPGSDVIVMNPNYLDEIRRMAGDRFHYLTLEDDSL